MSTAAQGTGVVAAGSVLSIPGTVLVTGLLLPAGLSFEEWGDIVQKLGLVARASLWWWGDALCYGERKWGEKYAQALDESEYEYQTLRDAKWIASQFELSRRRDKLSFAHHREVAALPPAEADALLDQAERESMTREELRRAVRRARRTVDPGPLPHDKYRVIYADPPWRYGDKLVEGYGPAEHHYETMSIEQLCEMDIAALALPDSVLFMWTTSPLLEDAFAVIRAWGFEYKTSFVWDKVKHNMGHYNSVRHELLLVCTRGSCTPDVPTLIDSVQTIERSDKHSEKPEEFRVIIDSLYTHGKRIDLFPRKAVDHWDNWGNEAAA